MNWSRLFLALDVTLFLVWLALFVVEESEKDARGEVAAGLLAVVWWAMVMSSCCAAVLVGLVALWRWAV